MDHDQAPPTPEDTETTKLYALAVKHAAGDGSVDFKAVGAEMGITPNAAWKRYHGKLKDHDIYDTMRPSRFKPARAGTKNPANDEGGTEGDSKKASQRSKRKGGQKTGKGVTKVKVKDDEDSESDDEDGGSENHDDTKHADDLDGDRKPEFETEPDQEPGAEQEHEHEVGDEADGAAQSGDEPELANEQEDIAQHEPEHNIADLLNEFPSREEFEKLEKYAKQNNHELRMKYNTFQKFLQLQGDPLLDVFLTLNTTELKDSFNVFKGNDLLKAIGKTLPSDPRVAGNPYYDIIRNIQNMPNQGHDMVQHFKEQEKMGNGAIYTTASGPAAVAYPVTAAGPVTAPFAGFSTAPAAEPSNTKPQPKPQPKFAWDYVGPGFEKLKDDPLEDFSDEEFKELCQNFIDEQNNLPQSNFDDCNVDW